MRVSCENLGTEVQGPDVDVAKMEACCRALREQGDVTATSK